MESLLECPVGGSTKPARDGNLLGLVGGEKKTFDKVEHVLKLICRRYEHLGDVGKGASMKLAINLTVNGLLASSRRSYLNSY